MSEAPKPESGAQGEDFEPPARRVLRRAWRLLQGPPERPTYWLTRAWFLRGLGLVYFVAFLTGVFQLVPLIGEEGLLPVGDYLVRIEERFGPGWDSFSELPSLFWFEHGDWFLVAVATAGAILALALMMGLSHPIQLIVMWGLYMSIDHVGQRWYSFGWETQLLETGFLAVFLCPMTSVRAYPARSATPTAVIVLLRWLAFRIMLGAGLIKLRGDPCWEDLTCLDYHFETQPIPHPLSWYLHQLPDWMLAGGVLFNHFVELVVPFVIFGPRRLRHAAGVLMIGFQVALIFSGNLAFLNWLTILPCIACFDDSFLRRFTPKWFRPKLDPEQQQSPANLPHRVVSYLFAAIVAYLSLPVVANLLGDRQSMNRSYDRLHLVNTYGAFGGVGYQRYELVIEGTADADPLNAIWREYEFKCKPGNLERTPCLITPYHRRLDWLIWFAALEAEVRPGFQREDWVFHLLYKLLQGDENALSLMGEGPFPDRPPRFVRVQFYRYEFTSFADDTDAWWKRRLVRTHIPPVSLEHEEFTDYLVWRGWLEQPSD
jgi:hypothetical protein